MKSPGCLQECKPFPSDREMCLEGFFNKEGFYTMSNFLKSLFGAKKAAKVTKSKMQTRRLELIGLEERITPAVVTVVGSTVTLTMVAGEAISDLHTVRGDRSYCCQHSDVDGHDDALANGDFDAV